MTNPDDEIEWLLDVLHGSFCNDGEHDQRCEIATLLASKVKTQEAASARRAAERLRQIAALGKKSSDEVSQTELDLATPWIVRSTQYAPRELWSTTAAIAASWLEQFHG